MLIWEDGDDELEENLEDDDWSDSDDDDLDYTSYVCEDCDYRWEEVSGEEVDSNDMMVCPMCGSVNVTQL